MAKRIISLGFLVLWLAAGSARADGGLIIEERYTEEHPGETQETAALDGRVNSSGQRAVLWMDDDWCWDLIIDPGTIEVGGAAWVLPLPVNPSVAPASPEFIDELDAATLPLLITEHRTVITYYSTHSSGGGGGIGCIGSTGDMAAEGDGGVRDETESTEEEGEAVEPPVQVWQTGRLGAVDYEVITSEDPEELARWLQDNGYVVPADLSEHISEYVSEGFFFFVARIVNDVADQSHLPVFRFNLCGMAHPSYPMRLTRLSVASELDFTLWLVLPGGSEYFTPLNAEMGSFGEFYDADYDTRYDYYDEFPDFQELYDERRRELRSARRGLALEMASTLTEELIERRIDVMGETTSDFPLSRDRMSWTDELYDIVSEGRRVMRLSGQFSMTEMAEDLAFEPGWGSVSPDSGIYTRTVTDHEERYVSDSDDDETDEGSDEVFGDADSSCAASGRQRSHTDGATIPLLVLGLMTLALIRRRLSR